MPTDPHDALGELARGSCMAAYCVGVRQRYTVQSGPEKKCTQFNALSFLQPRAVESRGIRRNANFEHCG